MIRARLAIGLALAVAFDTAVQFFSKSAVISLPDGLTLVAAIKAVLAEPIFLVVLGLMVCQLVNWLQVLKLADVSFAKPFTSLSYVTVSTVSFYFLGERLSTEQILGIVFIVLGVWCVAHSGWRSRNGVES